MEIDNWLLASSPAPGSLAIKAAQAGLGDTLANKLRGCQRHRVILIVVYIAPLDVPFRKAGKGEACGGCRRAFSRDGIGSATLQRGVDSLQPLPTLLQAAGMKRWVQREAANL